MTDAIWDVQRDADYYSNQYEKRNNRLKEIFSSLSEEEKTLFQEVKSAVSNFNKDSKYEDPLEEALALHFDHSRGRASSARTLLRDRRRQQTQTP